MNPLGLDQNRYAQPDDAALLHEQIRADLATKEALQPPKLLAQTALHECQAALIAAQTALDVAQSAYDNIAAHEAQLDVRLSRARGCFQSLRKLPDEILGIIFHEWLMECPRCRNRLVCDHVCMIAAAVCRWWRRVALGLPELWRGMTIRFGMQNAKYVQHWVSYLDIHRARSGRMGLHLEVSGSWDDSFRFTTASPGLQASFQTSVKRCFGKARVLSVKGGKIVLDRDIRNPRLFEQDAPYLVDFRIDIEAGRRRSLPFFRSAPLLQRVTVGRSLVLTLDPGHPGFPAVSEVELLDTDAHGLRAALISMPNIVSLAVSRGGLGSASTPAGFIAHSDTLRVLKWTQGQFCEETLISCVCFPLLEIAELEFDQRVWRSNRDAGLTAFLQHPMCTVRELTLDYLDDGALNGLRYTQSVTTLRFRKYTETCDAALRGLSRPTDDAGWLLPRVTDVCLPSNTKRFSISAIQGAILEFASARGSRAARVAPWSRPQALRSLAFKSEDRLRTLPRSLDQRIADILNPGAET